MGNSCCSKKKKFKKITLLLVGLDNAGKTVAAKNLAGEPVDTVVPTVGFSVINLTYQNYNVVLFDLGGGADIRGIWDEYFVYAHGVIFVVDSSDYGRLDEAKSVLQALLSHRKISGKPVLLLANKQDDENALDEIDIVEKLQLETIVNHHQCPTLVETCCASESTKKSTIDSGIKKGYRWLMNYVINHYADLNDRVENDVEEHEELERKTRLETIERIRILNEKEMKCKRDDDIIELYSEYEKQNGTANQIVQNVESNDDSQSEDESTSHIYHVKAEAKQDRPKSAVRMVMEQLEMEQVQKETSRLKFKSNKTVPMSAYGVSPPVKLEKVNSIKSRIGSGSSYKARGANLNNIQAGNSSSTQGANSMSLNESNPGNLNQSTNINVQNTNLNVINSTDTKLANSIIINPVNYLNENPASLVNASNPSNCVKANFLNSINGNLENVGNSVKFNSGNSIKTKGLDTITTTEAKSIVIHGVKLPHSASEKRTVYANGRRILRSAGDSIFIVSDLPNANPSPHADIFQAYNADKKAKLPPLRLHNTMNGNVKSQRIEENGISIIEVD